MTGIVIPYRDEDHHPIHGITVTRGRGDRPVAPTFTINMFRMNTVRALLVITLTETDARTTHTRGIIVTTTPCKGEACDSRGSLNTRIGVADASPLRTPCAGVTFLDSRLHGNDRHGGWTGRAKMAGNPWDT